MSRRRGWVVVAAACALGCGGSTTAGVSASDHGGAADASGSAPDAGASATDGGTSDGALPAATPQAILTLNGGAAAGCASVPAMKVGDFGDQTKGVPPAPVASGATAGGEVVTVTCRVAPSAGGFELQATIALANDATLSLQGTLDADGKTAAANLVLEKGSTKWTSTTCTTAPSAVGPFGGVAAGRSWTLFTCGGATSNDAATCDIFGQIRVENCREQ